MVAVRNGICPPRATPAEAASFGPHKHARRKARPMITYDLDRREPRQSKYEYLYRRVRADIRSGVLPAGTRLPSKRVLAEHLAVSVGTVERAYDTLVSEGYVEARPGSGFYVTPQQVTGPELADGVGGAPAWDTAREPAGAAPTGETGSDEARDLIDFKANWCSMSLFPAETWARMMRKVLSERTPELFETVPFNGLYELRRAIASHLLEFKGIRTTPDNIVIGAGTEYLYGKLLQLFGPNTVIAIGDPGYKKLADISRNSGVLWDYIPLDEQGPDVGRLTASSASVAHVSPANIFPTGVVMSAPRRAEMLGWLAARPNRYLIEDDYDSELRFSGRALPALFTQDTSGAIVYLNTFSKTLVPSLRISYMVLPDTLMELYERQLSFYSCTVSSFEQLALANFISQGHFERHVNRLRRYYGRQRKAAVEAITASPLAAIAEVNTPDVGTHLLLSVRTRMSDDAVKQAARERGMNLAMLSDYCVHPVARYAHNVVVNFASIEPDQLGRAVSLLVDVFREDIGRASRHRTIKS